MTHACAALHSDSRLQMGCVLALIWLLLLPFKELWHSLVVTPPEQTSFSWLALVTGAVSLCMSPGSP